MAMIKLAEDTYAVKRARGRGYVIVVWDERAGQYMIPARCGGYYTTRSRADAEYDAAVFGAWALRDDGEYARLRDLRQEYADDCRYVGDIVEIGEGRYAVYRYEGGYALVRYDRQSGDWRVPAKCGGEALHSDFDSAVSYARRHGVRNDALLEDVSRNRHLA